MITEDQLKKINWIGVKSGKTYAVESCLTEDGAIVRVRYREVGKPSADLNDVTWARFLQNVRPNGPPPPQEPAAPRASSSSKRRPGRRRAESKDKEECDVPYGYIITPDHRHDWDRIVLSPRIKLEIRSGLTRIFRATEMETVWGLADIDPRTKRQGLMFYGPPGTGKTLAATAIARQIQKPLYAVSVSELNATIVGGTAKNVTRVFEAARVLDCALFFDEADAILGRRSSTGGPNAFLSGEENKVVATILTHLDAFNGIAIFCTNLLSNIDEAFLRRMSRIVKFELPDASMRQQLLKIHLPKTGRADLTEEELLELTEACEGMSGGDILKLVMAAIDRVSLASSTDDWYLSIDVLVEEAQSILRSKLDYAQ